jgi:hypothetical protein
MHSKEKSHAPSDSESRSSVPEWPVEHTPLPGEPPLPPESESLPDLELVSVCDIAGDLAAATALAVRVHPS